jgi:hypothetical protein
VKALGEMVLLKEEMGRVGAIDQVWARNSGAAGVNRRNGSNENGARRSSIFSSSPSSSRSRSESESASGGEGDDADERWRASRRSKSHARAVKYDRITRESRDRARSREIERIQRERGHDQGG